VAILVKGLLIGLGDRVTDPTDVEGFPPVSYRQQRVRCGRDCDGCPHGPYWYAYWKDPDGRSRSQYIGGKLPADVRRLLEGVDGGAHGVPDAVD
jgi:hypothetical protein